VSRPNAWKFRRSTHVVCYWADVQLFAHNYADSTRLAVDAFQFSLINCCTRWCSVAVLARLTRRSHADIVRALAHLVRVGIVERSRRPLRSRVSAAALEGWSRWNPAAGFFHFSTRNVQVETDLAGSERDLRRKARTAPVPSPTKHYRGVPHVALPPPRTDGEFPSVLLARRTWRRFDPRRVSLEDLSTLLGLTFGVHMTGTGNDGRELVFKTSPSGGACHPYEAYVLALGVEGLPRGLYHYASDRHRLNVLKTGASRRNVARYVPVQWWYESAAAIVFMTAVFPRVQWRYQSPRAYRSVLVEAGHLCQTFCLVATWLRLAPFCTLMLGDAALERDLGVDGVAESFIYAAGVGSRPPGVDWAPWPEHRKGNFFLPPERRRR